MAPVLLLLLIIALYNAQDVEPFAMLQLLHCASKYRIVCIVSVAALVCFLV